MTSSTTTNTLKVLVILMQEEGFRNHKQCLVEQLKRDSSRILALSTEYLMASLTDIGQMTFCGSSANPAADATASRILSLTQQPPSPSPVSFVALQSETRLRKQAVTLAGVTMVCPTEMDPTQRGPLLLRYRPSAR
ncbi:hypothetical protein SAY87_006959 [Trapa incisa]|uniref:Uncharacterized protein n=1 Tax=Trapa incisa TaxID=236973 RepID=A0AAN7K231_9MYRT|nr:hypothetical protein SAY87_006959 [Trapa incisa]